MFFYFLALVAILFIKAEPKHFSMKFERNRNESFLLLLVQEGQLSVTGESMSTKYWLTA